MLSTHDLVTSAAKSPLLLCSACLIAVRHTSDELASRLAPALFDEAQTLVSRALLTANTPGQHGPTPDDGQGAAGNQILGECDWFAHTGTSDTPIWIGVIYNSAFATRFRQFASSSQAPCHIPRTQFASDDAICGLANATPAWPSPSRARFLVDTTRQFLRRNYHVVRQSKVFLRTRASRV